MKRIHLAVLGICLAGTFLLGIFLGFVVPRLGELAVHSPTYTSSTLLTQVQTVSELVTVKYIIERVVVQEDVKWIPGLGENRVLLLAHGVVKAGIDLSKLAPQDFQYRPEGPD